MNIALDIIFNIFEMYVYLMIPDQLLNLNLDKKLKIKYVISLAFIQAVITQIWLVDANRTILIILFCILLFRIIFKSTVRTAILSLMLMVLISSVIEVAAMFSIKLVTGSNEIFTFTEMNLTFFATRAMNLTLNFSIVKLLEKFNIRLVKSATDRP